MQATLADPIVHSASSHSLASFPLGGGVTVHRCEHVQGSACAHAYMCMWRSEADVGGFLYCSPPCVWRQSLRDP